ncbi:hypothetical protein [Streptomyces sp. bgisy022]|uniref:hypothetical protein n=1 Tax=Streptomyces sp. bgisy022 TaxID=3413769 RepID=UPI003D70E7F9
MTTAHPPSRNCYLSGCRADGCRTAASRYTKQLRVEHARGHYRMTHAGPARQRIQDLMTAGWTQRQIARASGVEAASIHQVYVGAQEKTAKWRAAAILAIPVTTPPPNTHRIDATGTRRRLQALRVLGHRRYDLAAALDITADRIKHITNGNTKYVTPAEAAAIARLYRRLSAIPGPSQQTATLARNKGWHGPLAWDDIDDPNCQPETCERRQGGPGRREAVDPLEVARLTRAGMTAAEIAMRLGCHKRTVTRARGRVTHHALQEAA